MTPEGRVKNKINKLLARYGDAVYYHMPVPVGYGRRTVDYLGCARGVFFAIEAKRPGGRPTRAQEGVLDDVRAAGGSVFAIADDAGLAALERFLDYVTEMTPA